MKRLVCKLETNCGQDARNEFKIALYNTFYIIFFIMSQHLNSVYSDPDILTFILFLNDQNP